MKLSVKVEYACRVLAQIARLHGTGELAHVETLAQAEAIPANYLAQILSELREGGLITSRRGKQGGYALARPPETISLYDIVMLMEGSILEIGESSKGQSSRRTLLIWQDVRKTFEDHLRHITLDRLIAQSPEDMYYI